MINNDLSKIFETSSHKSEEEKDRAVKSNHLDILKVLMFSQLLLTSTTSYGQQSLTNFYCPVGAASGNSVPDGNFIDAGREAHSRNN